MIRTKAGNPLFLKNTYKNSSIFFLGSGPSLLEQDLTFLSNTQILSFGINNISARYTTNFWACADSPKSFHEVIWKNPCITKFVPFNKSGFPILEGKNRVLSSYPIHELPNVFFYNLDSKFNTKEFLKNKTISWGCQPEIPDDLGIKGGRSTMLIALKIMWWLGFKNIFLLGCDFNMQQQKPYAFEQNKKPPGIQSNNTCYHLINKRLKVLQPGFETKGRRIYNCTPNSKLNAFSFLPVEKAVEMALENQPKYQIKLDQFYGKG